MTLPFFIFYFCIFTEREKEIFSFEVGRKRNKKAF